MRRVALPFVAVLLLAIVRAPAADPPAGAVPRAERVMLISVDGLRPDLLVRANTPNIRFLLTNGSYTFWARTVDFAYTLPAHASMLTGVSPEKHGVTWLERVEDTYPKVPTLFEAAKAAGLSTALVSGKTKFNVFDKPGALDWTDLPPAEPVLDTAVAARAAAIIRQHKPHVMLVHLPGVDYVGHVRGWGSPDQLVWVGEADKAVGAVLAALNEAEVVQTTLVILTADHGGAGVEHLPGDERAHYVPWVAVGPGVRKGMDLTRYPDLKVNVIDTFATACAALGITPDAAVEGKAVAEISASSQPPSLVPKATEGSKTDPTTPAKKSEGGN